MAETPTSPNPPPEDMHWGISYLREDIQDLRQGVRALHDRVDRIAETSAQRIDRVEQSLTTRIAVVAETLTKRVDSRFALLLTTMVATNGLVVGTIITFLQLRLPAH